MATKPSPPVKKLVVLEEATLISLANQPQFVKQFPFLTSLKNLASSRSQGCNSCGGGKARNTTNTSTILAAKQTLAGMGDDKKRLLKKLLNTEKLRITYKQGKRIVQHTF